ncbi:YceD family protein [Ancylobacter pratisalsi]|uniref:DUF177 domain-containing protein n=1 Tax=Ancylobacter pratisalsi TaxID=1745854 RepID=A0A6P1YS79_9HYPH|nr:DUF177 domain-containing protein [Ancylobacter pratisalsi]QIB35875.1 DUF177 domain-containing protein [Ancylobacter pratisalsi]
MKSELPFSHPVIVAGLPDDGLTLNLTPDAEVRAALARDFGIPGIVSLKARVTVLPLPKGEVRVGGHVDAVVTQTCVVTLENFDTKVSEDIDMHFAPDARIPEIRPGAEIDVGELELPDPLIDGTVDVGAVVAEFVALGLDAYPRKPGVVFESPAVPSDEELSPFAALAQLRDDGKKGQE